MPTQSTLHQLQKSLWGYDPGAHSCDGLLSKAERLEAELLAVRKRISEARDVQGLEFSEQMFFEITKVYKFLFEMSMDGDQVIINTRNMPFTLARSNVLGDHTRNLGVYFTTYPYHRFDIRLDRGGAVFTNTLNPAPKEASTIGYSVRSLSAILSDCGFRGDFAKWDVINQLDATHGRNSRGYSHPHAHGSGSGRFSDEQICVGTNRFRGMLRELKSGSEFKSALNYLLLWLRTGNSDDWHGSSICPYVNIDESVGFTTNTELHLHIYGVFQEFAKLFHKHVPFKQACRGEVEVTHVDAVDEFREFARENIPQLLVEGMLYAESGDGTHKIMLAPYVTAYALSQILDSIVTRGGIRVPVLVALYNALYNAMLYTYAVSSTSINDLPFNRDNTVVYSTITHSLLQYADLGSQTSMNEIAEGYSYQDTYDILLMPETLKLQLERYRSTRGTRLLQYLEGTIPASE